MTIQTKTYLYEAMIRFSEEGYAGSHQIRMQKVWDDETGEILSERELGAEPVADAAIVDLVGGQSLLMGRQITELTAECERLKEALAAAQSAAPVAPSISA